MSDIAIRTEGLSKRYQLGDKERYYALRDTLTRMVRSPLSFFRREKGEYIYALKDVDLEVKQGEVLGLIGRNGAGKTTLLKLLSQITRPTAGWADIYGRVGSLLEVGTGFHPELTGRENIYLSGAILGMTKKEINRRFEEIVAFSELEKFLDTAVKHYSSGMYVRLAFAVAAHLEPEILLVDEVLAVGDIKFQKKCLGKMSDVARTGRTIVLISHQMNQIRRLCERVVWIDAGTVRQDGRTHDVLGAYEADMLLSDRSPSTRGKNNTDARFTSWELDPAEPDREQVLSTLEPVRVNFCVELARPIQHGVHGAALYNSERQLMWGQAASGLELSQGTHILSHSFPSIPLKPGVYQWQVTLWEDGRMLDLWDAVPEMNIATEDYQHYQDQWSGVLNVPTEFSHRVAEELPIEPSAHI